MSPGAERPTTPPIKAYFDPVKDEGLQETLLRSEYREYDLTTSRDNEKVDVGGYDWLTVLRITDRVTMKVESQDRTAVDLGVGIIDVRSVDRIYLSNDGSAVLGDKVLRIVLTSGWAYFPATEAKVDGARVAEDVDFERVTGITNAGTTWSPTSSSDRRIRALHLKANSTNPDDVEVHRLGGAGGHYLLEPGDELRMEGHFGAGRINLQFFEAAAGGGSDVSVMVAYANV